MKGPWNIANPLTDDGRNKINEMFQELYNEYREAGLNAKEARNKAEQAVTDALIAKETAEVTREEMLEIIREQTRNGDLAPEIAQARQGHETLGENLNSIKSQLAQTANELGYSVYNHKDLVVDDDWTEAFKATALAIKGTNKIFFIPDNTFHLSDGIEIYNSVECHGKLIWNGELVNAENFITFSRKEGPIAIDTTVNTLSGLNKGSTRIEGLNGYKGATVYLTSSEKIITRADGNGDYFKRETSKVTSNNGDIYPPLEHTYTDYDRLSVYIYPEEEKLVTNNITVEVNSDVDLSQLGVVRSEVSNAEHNNLTIKNKSDTKLDTGLSVSNATNVILNNPTIDGVKEDDVKGYGITISNSSDVTINNGHIPHGRHSISGVNNKLIKIDGGTYNLIDCHYGSDYVINNIKSKKEIWFAGRNITVTNSEFTEANRIVSIRNDTPELAGKVIIDNVDITSSGRIDLITYLSQDQNATFHRMLENPSYVSIKNVRAHTPDLTYLLTIPANRNYDQRSWGIVNIEDIDITQGDGAIHITRQENWIDGTGVTLNLKNINIPKDKVFNLNLRSYVDDLTEHRLIDVNVDRITSNTNLMVDSTAAGEMNISNVNITKVDYYFSRTNTKDWFFRDSVFDGVNITYSTGRYHFRNCIFKGDGWYQRGKIGSSMNNIAVVGARNYPPLNNYVNEELFVQS